MLASLALATAALGARPEVSAASLANLVDSSTVICIGKVERWLGGDPAEFEHPSPLTPRAYGRVHVELVLQGPLEPRELWHVRWLNEFQLGLPSELGKRCLFFFGPEPLEHTPDEERARRVQLGLPAKEVLCIAGGGQGVIEIRESAAGSSLQSRSLPQSLRTSKAGIPVESCELWDVLDYIQNLQRFSGDEMCMHVLSPKTAEREVSFDLRVRRDGKYRLARNVDWFTSPAESVEFGRWSAEKWAALQKQLEELLGARDRTLRLVPAGFHNRLLDLRLAHASLVCKFDNEKHGEPVGEQCEDYRTALRCWAAARAAITEDGLAEHRASDDYWIAKH